MPKSDKATTFDLMGKVAIITGGSQGIGEAIVRELAGSGCDVLATARSKSALTLLSNELEASTGRRVVGFTADLRDENAGTSIVNAAIEAFGKIDLLVNNAGSTKNGTLFDVTEEDWTDGFGVKFFGGMRLSKAAWPHLKDSNGGIVSIAGIRARTPTGGSVITSSVNSAIVGLTKALADQGRVDGVKVNGIHPGPVRTGRLKATQESMAAEKGIDQAEVERQMIANFGVTRIGEPEDIARLVAFLASPLGANIHGTFIDSDGGATRGV
jgi:NAD(P)-dependent dehydrogenase (short-subunit alcohol dehydrogenase family)